MKPVAWKDDLEFYTPEDYEFFVKQGIHKNMTPLYSKPKHKELSDEEISEIAHEHNLLDDYPHDFARAIIKASRGEE